MTNRFIHGFGHAAKSFHVYGCVCFCTTVQQFGIGEHMSGRAIKEWYNYRWYIVKKQNERTNDRISFGDLLYGSAKATSFARGRHE